MVSRADADGYYDGVLDRERVMIYDLLWRLIEERIDDGLAAEPGDGFDRVCQQVWGARHVDDAVLRRENRDFTNDGAGASYESTWYYVTDALFGVVAVIDGATGMTVERVRYLPYGGARHSLFADIDGDGATTNEDQTLLLASSGAAIGEPGYLCEADLNRDGVIDGVDLITQLSDFGAALPAGQISAIDSPVGFVGYIIDDATGLYAVRNRTYGPGEGRWMERDPAGYVDGSGLYEYVRGRAVSYSDPFGICMTMQFSSFMATNCDGDWMDGTDFANNLVQEFLSWIDEFIRLASESCDKSYNELPLSQQMQCDRVRRARDFMRQTGSTVSCPTSQFCRTTQCVTISDQKQEIPWPTEVAGICASPTIKIQFTARVCFGSCEDRYCD